MTFRRRLLPIALAAALLALAVALSGCRGRTYVPHLRYRWVYVSSNLLVDANLPPLEAVMKRARAAGYNGVVLADYKFSTLDTMGAHFFRNVARIQRAAKALGMEIYPLVCPIGYSGGLLSHNPNLAEGPPVRDALFVEQRGAADLVPDPPAGLKGGDFESAQGDQLAGWDLQDFPGRSTFADRAVHHGGRQSLRMERIGEVDPRSGHARVEQTVSVSPFRQYHLSVWIKTRDFETPGSARVAVLSPSGQPLSFGQWEIQQTQEWTQYHAVFNSLDNHEIKLYLGVWEGKGGAIWWDDASLEEVGLLNVLRRAGCPLTVKGEDGTAYQEGRDFEPVKDGRLEAVKQAGEYEIYHAPPSIRLTPNSRIRDGQRLRVSFYHVETLDHDQAACCLSDPQVYALLKDEIARVNRLLHPKGFFMSHDEIREANWCETCRNRKLTPGQLLADNTRRCAALIRAASPRATLFDWSDMFDPSHNAHGDYYLVNGSWAGSWEGLPKDVIVVNWNFDKRRQSMPWFAKQGHSQILAGYYDGDPDAIRTWLGDARTVPNIVGVMYTTWEHRYGDLEAFAKAAWGQ